MSLQRNGLLIGSSSPIDNLTYKYSGNSNYTNQLSSVSDAVAINNHLGDFYDANTADNDYTYDANGNLKTDKNKAISSIAYNYLNLPDTVTITAKGIIRYVYDAAGNKLKKTVVDQTITPNKTTVTTYIGGFVYQNDTLQFAGHEEGRIRPQLIVPATGYTPANINWVYDYFEKDHLGNVRMVLTEKQDTSFYPAATMETAQAATEEVLYANLPETRTDKSTVAGYPTDNTTSPNDKIAKVSGNGQKIGPSIVLKVMAGDKFNIKVSSWYQTNGATPGTPDNSLTDLVAGLITGLSGPAGAAHGNITAATLQSSGVITPDATDFLNNQPAPGTKPKAYLNWILLDEQFKFVASGSGAEQVGDNEEFKQHVKTNLPVTKNGYLYVYVSNETPNIDVFFDNLQVTHIHGQMLEETHYYPFGLTMSGISSEALNGTPENKYKYNKGSELQSKEFSDGSGLEMYDTHFRQFDPQLGRWNQIDPSADSSYYLSTYVAMSNNPILRNDPLGDKDSTKQAYTPAPKALPGFPDAGKRIFNPESARYRWKLPDGSILEWDKQHGEVEKYDKTGKNHQGSYDPESGDPIKDPVPGRTTPKTIGLPNPANTSLPTPATPSLLGQLWTAMKVTLKLSTNEPSMSVSPNLGKAIATGAGATGAAAAIIETTVTWLEFAF